MLSVKSANNFMMMAEWGAVAVGATLDVHSSTVVSHLVCLQFLQLLSLLIQNLQQHNKQRCIVSSCYLSSFYFTF
jgi:hypothetical protein